MIFDERFVKSLVNFSKQFVLMNIAVDIVAKYKRMTSRSGIGVSSTLVLGQRKGLDISSGVEISSTLVLKQEGGLDIFSEAEVDSRVELGIM